ncbi:glycosyl hydrolase [Maribellus sp. CM-23]|uniref:WD40/YVTN/BNR-like repeat-containing protein n=1 Tax=Maribellus sp. CM-23 TaxID=2781026 RepID=UPI001F2235E2|nr:glycosyl hydrolase [Maribellus sp. CM-23]MCE4563253.1 glycosyl hydrolase [Maribellus sp. CM-23]
MKKLLLLLAVVFLFSTVVNAKKKEDEKKEEPKSFINSGLVSGLKWRSIGPAWASGRIADFAVNPNNTKEYYVGVASGNVWKTENNGTTWKPVFDNYGTYSIGVVVLDPNNANVVWVGTGENNHQRALGYGDGVYKSLDGGKSFKNMGLKESRQIGGIVIDPRNSDVVFVAAEGSAWGPGAERGLYKSTDGGENWKKVLEISENTGVNNVKIDPSNPDIMYATSEQRRRTSFTKIGGGPESAVYKSTDGGENWRKVTKGLPSVQLGGMGIDVSPVDPNVVYLIVEAADNKGGFYRSTDKGESWEKMSDHHSSGQYYNEIYCDPKDVDKVYSVETRSVYTTDAGKTWNNITTKTRHVDDHAIWIDQKDTEHFIIGGDGGIYESWDGGLTFDFKENLPVTQFYRVFVDDAEPFYNVYGGTQDNNSMGGPSRNTSRNGVVNDDWYITMGGDGFWAATEPGNPDIVYTEYQYGNMFRYDKKSEETISIKPRERKGELTYKWNWNAPLILSPHMKTRLYVAANKVFRSDDRGNTWEVISDDLTAQVDRNSFPVMGKYWPADAVAKDVSTSQWGTIVSLDESKLKEGLLYAGTDDGVISITENGGDNWTQVKSFPGVPEYTYVSDLLPDRYDENVVYATFDNLKRDDFKPYVYKSTDKGKTWTSISGNLPENGTVHTLAQDFLRPELLFAGTEFGIYFTVDNGQNWIEMKADLPTIAVRDIAIQERESDLVIATFGRGFYILDDYSPLREVTPDLENKTAAIFPVKDALMYIQTDGKDNQGDTYFYSKNPEYGATFTYFLKEVPKTKKELRKDEEKKLFEEGKPIPQPSWRELQLEDQQEKTHLIFTVYDQGGNVVSQFAKSPSKGINRVNWNMTYTATAGMRFSGKFDPVSSGRNRGIMVLPGTYKVGMQMWHEGELSTLVEPLEFTCRKLNNTTLPAEDYRENVDFAAKVNKLALSVVGAGRLISESMEKVEQIKQAIYATPGAGQQLMDKARALGVELEALNYKMNGVPAKASGEEVPPEQVPLNDRLGHITYTHMGSTSGITTTEKRGYEILKEEFPPVLESLRKMVEQEIPALEAELNKINAPWTPGRLIDWKE